MHVYTINYYYFSSHQLVGIPLPPQDFEVKFEMNFSSHMLKLSWVAPNSLPISTLPTISHYVLSNNLTNRTKTFPNPTTCNPLASCSYSLELRDPFFISVGAIGRENATILDYYGRILFTFFAVNGAGIGSPSSYIFQRKTSTG